MIKLMHVSDYHIKTYSVKPWHLSEKSSTYIGKGINHTIETYHLIIRLAFDTSFAYVKTNNGVKIFSWEEYITLSENDFDPWFEIVSTINYVYKTKKNRAEPKK